MHREVTFGSKIGIIGYVPMCVILLICISVMVSAFPPFNLFFAMLLMSVEVIIILIWKGIRYTFDDEKMTVNVPLGMNVEPVYYHKVWKVVDTDREILGNHHGMSEDAIRIWYDKERGRYICISPDDKSRAMDILRRRCPDAEFSVEGGVKRTG